MKLFKLNKEQSLLEGTSFGVLLALLFLLPIIISPSGLLSFSFAKTFVTVFAVVVTFSLLILFILKKGSIVLPRSLFTLTLLAVPIVTLVSSLLSNSKQTALIGYGIEVDTFFFMLILFALMFLVMQTFTSAKRVFYAYTAFVISILIIFLFHGSRFIFGPEFLSFGSFTQITSNTFGNWHDLAILSGLVVILSMTLLETVRITRQMKIIAIVLFVIGLIFLAIVNSFIVWLVLGILSLISFVYLFSPIGKEDKLRNIPIFSIIILVISVIFLIARGQAGDIIYSILNINSIDVRPTWGATFEVAKQTFSSVKNILLGSGPNTFSTQWAQFKPNVVNQTVLWNNDFNYGISYVATSMVTSGVLGVLAWLSFFVFFVYQGFISFFVKEEQSAFIRYLSISSFVSAFFLWTMLIFFVPGVVVVILTFFFSGIFLAVTAISGVSQQKEISFTKKPRVGFVITLVLVFILILGINLGYTSFRKTVSSIYYQRGLRSLNQEGNIIAASQDISRAISFAKHDMYYRSLVDLNLFQLNQILSTEDLSSSVVVARVQQTLGTTVANAQAAIASRPLDYKNYAVLGAVYAAIVPLNVEGAIAGARQAYQSAIERAPKNPSLLLALARLEANQGDVEMARQRITESLALKSNYTDAIFTLAQIEIATGNVDEAIASVEVATLIEPNNPALHFQLGFLYYNKKDFRDAATAFENAIAIAPDYANAKYFLGLTYYELSRRRDAISQFKNLEISNPDNQEVKFILENLESGVSPFNKVQPPLDDEPEGRDELPVEEDES